MAQKIQFVRLTDSTTEFTPGSLSFALSRVGIALSAFAVLISTLALSPDLAEANGDTTAIPVWDTAWDMPTRATLEEVDQYFDHLATAGFHGVWLSYFNQWSLDGKNRYGDSPAHIDAHGAIVLNQRHAILMGEILDRAKSRGLAVGMVAMWANSYVNDFDGDDCTPNAGVLTADNAQQLGRQLGDAIGKHPALELWIFGGDNWCDQAAEADVNIWRNLAAGLDAAGATQTTTYHTAGWTAAHRKFMSEEWLDVLSPQTTHCDAATITAPLLADLIARQPKPVIAAEMRYEAIEPSWCQTGSYGPDNPVPATAILEDARAALAVGASAYVYGHNERWLWGGGTLGSEGQGWPSVSKTFGAAGEQLMLEFFKTGAASPVATSVPLVTTTRLETVVPTTVVASTTPPSTTTPAVRVPPASTTSIPTPLAVATTVQAPTTTQPRQITPSTGSTEPPTESPSDAEPDSEQLDDRSSSVEPLTRAGAPQRRAPKPATSVRSGGRSRQI